MKDLSQIAKERDQHSEQELDRCEPDLYCCKATTFNDRPIADQLKAGNVRITSPIALNLSSLKLDLPSEQSNTPTYTSNDLLIENH